MHLGILCWFWKWEALTLIFKVIWPFRLTKRHSTLLLYTDLGRPMGATRPKPWNGVLFFQTCTFFAQDLAVHGLRQIKISKPQMVLTWETKSLGRWGDGDWGNELKTSHPRPGWLNKPALVQIMVCRPFDGKPFPEPVMGGLLAHVHIDAHVTWLLRSSIIALIP